MSPKTRDPGLDGVVPFRFACHRCGNCCSGHSGFVWLEEGEVERLAAALGATPAAFVARHVRTARDPVSGELRAALRETEAEGGRCTLLAGKNTCTAYDARPEQCRTFPYWERVLEHRESFEAARATCPGIAVEVDEATRTRAFAALAAWYASRPECAPPARCCLADARAESRSQTLDARGDVEGTASINIAINAACDTKYREVTFATALEVDYALHAAPEPAGACRLGDRRPSACRESARGEDCLQAVRRIEREVGYPAAYAPLAALISTREFVR